MRIDAFARAFFRSPAGIGAVFLGLGSGGAALFLGGGPFLAAAAAAGAVAAVVGAALASGAAQRAASAELEREDAAKAASRLDSARGLRSRLAALRIARPEVAKARDLVVLEAGSFIEECGRAGSYDPAGIAAIEESLELVDAWLKEADASATERRFELPDADPIPDAAGKIAAALRGKAAAIAAGRSRVSGGMLPSDRIAIEEELR